MDSPPNIRSSYRIGLVADTHDVDDPRGVVERLARLGCDYNVHLGDMGGCRAVMAVVREFKRNLGKVDHLPAPQQAQFRMAVGVGVPAVRAYIDTRLDGKAYREREIETAHVYRDLLGRFETLSNPILLYGNVDSMQLRMQMVEDAFAGSRLSLLKRPRLLDLDWLGLLVWPSWRPKSPAELAELQTLTRGLAAHAATKRQLVVFAHEQLFKGPSAAVYARRVAAAGLLHRTVPRFDPNPTWPYLLWLFRSLPATVNVTYAFGHIHDPVNVILAGAPALRNPAGGMRYRLYGPGGGDRAARRKGIRTISMFPVAVNEVAEVVVSREDVSWRVIGG